MKALLLDAYRHLTFVDHPDPRPARDELLIKVERCGICGSDIHGYDGSSGRRMPPIVMGHEASGTVAGVGDEVNDFSEGDRVTFDSTIYCGSCTYCSAGRLNLCERRRVLGVSCDEYRRDGAFAEFVAVPARGCYRLPDGVSFDAAALTEPLSIAVHAVELAGSVLGRRVVVVGAGVIGSMLVTVVRAAGCASCTVLDTDASRRERVSAIGAGRVLDPAAFKTHSNLIADSGGEADIVFEAVGIPATVSMAIDLVRKGGTVVLVGNVTPSVEVQLQRTVTREIRLQGSCGSAGEYGICLDLLESGAVPVDRIVDAVAPLAEGASWFDRLYSREPGLLKVLLSPDA